MTNTPRIIRADQLGEVIAEHFRGLKTINCYVGSNAATPTTLIEALSQHHLPDHGIQGPL